LPFSDLTAYPPLTFLIIPITSFVHVPLMTAGYAGFSFEF
jgi:hypothetical protein